MRQFDLPGGVMITDVDDNSVGNEAGLREDFVITGVVMGGRITPINSVADFTALEARLRPGTSLVLKVRVPDQYARDVNISMRVR
jgi:S1-C subfamily serine protease